MVFDGVIVVMTSDDCASELTLLGSVFLDKIYHHMGPSLRAFLEVREGINADPTGRNELNP